MPKRTYYLYPDSGVISVYTDPARVGELKGDVLAFWAFARTRCTLLYSKVTLEECGEENTDHKHLAEQRLKALRGQNIRAIRATHKKIISVSNALLIAAFGSIDVKKSLLRDARHLAAASIGGADVFVTENTKDFAASSNLIKYAEEVLKGFGLKLPVISSVAEAIGLVLQNPMRRKPIPKCFRLTYARQQYWSMRDCGVAHKKAKTYIQRKWKVKL